MDSLIEEIQLLKSKAINEGILDKENEIKNLLINLEIEDKPVANFNNKEDFKLVKVLEKALILLSLSIFPTKKSAFHINLPFNENDDRE